MEEHEQIAMPPTAPSVPDPAVSPLTIVMPDADRVYIDRAGLAHRVEDLEPEVRQVVEEAFARPREILPRNEMLKAASLLLAPHLRALPPADRIAVVLIAARAIDEAELARWHTERLERRVVDLEAEVARLRKLEARAPISEVFPGRCPICGLTPTPADGHRLERWPKGWPELDCPAGMRGRRVGLFGCLGTRWIGQVGALRLPREEPAAPPSTG